jgi:hypothetical protein
MSRTPTGRPSAPSWGYTVLHHYHDP